MTAVRSLPFVSGVRACRRGSPRAQASIVFVEGDVEFRILGPLEAVDGTRPVSLTRGKQRALLALLLLHADRVVAMDRLVDDLWGAEVPASAPKMVQILVSLLRKQLPQGLIQTRSPGYRLDLNGHSLDLRTFETLHARGRALADDRAADAVIAFRQALELWRGAPLAEFEEPFARLEESRLVEEHLTCVEECIEAELTLGRHAELVGELDALVRRHPLRERLRRLQMLALYRCGRHAEALEAFQSFRRKLRDELGIEPPPQLKDLERLVLQQDRSLDLASSERAREQDVPPTVAATQPEARRLEFGILGPLEVRDGERVVPLGGLRRRAVLGLLLLEANRVVSVDRLVDGVWGNDPPASAQASLQNHLFRLRRELDERLVTRPPGYLLRVAPGELDLDRFRHLVEEAEGAEPDVAAEHLRDALALWRGSPLADLAAEPAGRAAAHLGELRLSALEARIDADLALGRHAQLVPELEELVAREPHRERLRRQLIVALYRSERQADALDAYTDARRTLVEELGTEPGRDLQELQRAVLRQDPTLDAPAAVAPAPSRAPLAEARKTVTIVVADVAPADAPADPEARRTVLSERARAAEVELGRHGASATSLGAARVLGVFGVPAAGDDDSLRAVRAAVALRSSHLATRVGLSTGEVVTGDPLVSGAPVDEAARLQEQAEAGEVLAAARTWRVVRHAVTGSPRDGAWAIDAVDPDADPLLRRLETPLVGRDRELREIADAFERAVAEGRPHLVTVFGAPGVGKTRLSLECMERLRGAATPVVGRCTAGAQEDTYAPLREVLATLADGDPSTWIHTRLDAQGGAQLAEQLASAVGLVTGTAHAGDTALAARRVLAGVAQERPLLLVLEDIHWAAPAFLDLVESLVELAHAPALALCLARPDLLDLRPNWGGGRLSSSAILLDVLTPDESQALVDRLSSDEDLDIAARERILAVSEGNPLFIEQLLAVALEGDSDALPDSIQTLLAARLDRLDEPDRSVVQAAAVCGASFRTEDVAALVDGDPAASLVTLVRRELVRTGEAGDPDRDCWSFRHSLIRDVAYGSIPKRQRAELHERLAARAADRGTDGDLEAGLHLDQAVRARREIGETGATVDGLTGRAAEHLWRAGLAAYDREDMAATISLLGRANDLLPRDRPERLELALKLGDALSWVGEREAGRRVTAEARALAVELDDTRLAARAKLSMGLPSLWADVEASPEEMLRDVDDASSVLERAGDHEGLAIAEVARFHLFDRSGLPDPEERLSTALAHARKAGDRHMEHHVMGWICITLPRGSVPVEAAIARVDEIVEASSSAYVHASALGALGLLRAQRGEFDAARALVEESRLALEELGLRQAEAAHSIAMAEVEMLAGDEAAAERILKAGFDAVATLDDEHSVVNVAWRLGLLLARQRRDDEAERFVRVAEGAEAGLWVDVWWRVVLALVEAHRGEAAHARELVAEARALMAPAAPSGMHADALLESADALRATGCEEEAAALVAEAAGIAERLGYVVALRRAEEARPAPT